MASIRHKDAFVAQKELASASKLCLDRAINSELNYFNCRNISHKSAKGFPAEEYSLFTGTQKETSAKICYFKETDLLFFAQTLHKRYTAGNRWKYSALLAASIHVWFQYDQDGT